MTDDASVFEFCALCGDSLQNALDTQSGVCQDCMDTTPEPGAQRGRLPDEVYATDADYVKLAFKTMTAQRMAGWLRGYADYCDFAGNDITATHARGVANRIAAEVEPESVHPVNPGDRSEGER
jgi:hypothetical protein